MVPRLALGIGAAVALYGLYRLWSSDAVLIPIIIFVLGAALASAGWRDMKRGKR